MGVKIPIGQIGNAFCNAQKVVLEKLGQPTPTASHFKLTMDYWKAEFNVILTNDSGWARITHAEFPSEEDLTFFMLKWS